MMDLLPCPFCGNAQTTEKDYRAIRMRHEVVTTGAFGLQIEPFDRYYVQCGVCFARTGNCDGVIDALGNRKSPEELERMAVKRWNART